MKATKELGPHARGVYGHASYEVELTKASFKELVSRRRCVIPADGFYEWRRAGNHKVPMWIHLKDKEPFVFAGLWDSEVGGTLNTFTIITTEPNEVLRPIRNRMPVIYDTAMGRQWLDQSFSRPEYLEAVLRSWPSEKMERGKCRRQRTRWRTTA